MEKYPTSALTELEEVITDYFGSNEFTSGLASIKKTYTSDAVFKDTMLVPTRAELKEVLEKAFDTENIGVYEQWLSGPYPPDAPTNTLGSNNIFRGATVYSSAPASASDTETIGGGLIAAAAAVGFTLLVAGVLISKKKAAEDENLPVKDLDKEPRADASTVANTFFSGFTSSAPSSPGAAGTTTNPLYVHELSEVVSVSTNSSSCEVMSSNSPSQEDVATPEDVSQDAEIKSNSIFMHGLSDFMVLPTSSSNSPSSQDSASEDGSQEDEDHSQSSASNTSDQRALSDWKRKIGLSNIGQSSSFSESSTDSADSKTSGVPKSVAEIEALLSSGLPCDDEEDDSVISNSLSSVSSRPKTVKEIERLLSGGGESNGPLSSGI